jgi:hypothetical protein
MKMIATAQHGSTRHGHELLHKLHNIKIVPVSKWKSAASKMVSGRHGAA